MNEYTFDVTLRLELAFEAPNYDRAIDQLLDKIRSAIFREYELVDYEYYLDGTNDEQV